MTLNKRWQHLAVRPIEDEMVLGLVVRLRHLAGPIGLKPFFRDEFGISELYTSAHMTRAVVASGAWGDPELVARNHTFTNYFKQFAGGPGTGRFPLSAVDMMVSGRCFQEFDKFQLHLGIRVCSACSDDQFRTYGFRTYLRSHNLPGVSACWKHGIRLHRLSEAPYSLSMPQPLAREDCDHASAAEVWMARTSRDALFSTMKATHYLPEVRHPGSEEQGDAVAAEMTERLLSAYPSAFLEFQQLDAQSLKRRLRMMTRGHAHRSIGCTRILLLASTLRFRTR